MSTKTIMIKRVQNEFSQNTYIIEFENACVVIDAGSKLDKVQKVTNKPLGAVFITHGHYDHIRNIEEYDKLNIPIYANENIFVMLNDSDKNASKLFGVMKAFKVKNLKFVKNNEEIKIEEHIIKCLLTKGHSIDSMCYLMDNETLFSGDTLFENSFGRFDLETGNREELIKSLNVILNLDYKLLYAGHGIPSDKQQQKTNIPKWIDYLS